MPRGDEQDVDLAVQAAHRALTTGPWAEMTATERGALMRKLGDLIAQEATSLAETEVRDNGKLFAEMHGQLNYLPQWFYYYGGLADKIEGSTLPLDKKGYFAFTRHEPVGVVVAITPWNSPLLLLAWKLAPALAAGCTVVVKPSEFTSASTLEFAALFEKAGFPPGVFNVVTGFGAEVGTALVEHPLVAKISFTGSDATGRIINEKAARLLKHTSMELGGKSPNVVFEDADLEQAVFGAISGIFAATGQTCIAGSRLLVQRSIHDEFVKRLLEVASSARMGDPMSADTQVGPVTTPPQFKKVLDYIDVAKKEGATAVLGGK
ncbi:aldehyde dehydrogenase family protein, partial [Alcaligenaceae bacterium]|nr:aldehyde dehydrogenase family protein [Alcaligenaceae bacterium]